MKHADKLINRILMLEGLSNLPALHKLTVGENTSEMLQCDLKLEHMSQKTAKESIAARCPLAGWLAGWLAGDYISRAIFQEILDDTEEHIDWLETQIDKIGLQNFLPSKLDAQTGHKIILRVGGDNHRSHSIIKTGRQAPRFYCRDSY